MCFWSVSFRPGAISDFDGWWPQICCPLPNKYISWWQSLKVPQVIISGFHILCTHEVQVHTFTLHTKNSWHDADTMHISREDCWVWILKYTQRKCNYKRLSSTPKTLPIPLRLCQDEDSVSCRLVLYGCHFNAKNHFSYEALLSSERFSRILRFVTVGSCCMSENVNGERFWRILWFVRLESYCMSECVIKNRSGISKNIPFP